MVRTTRKRGRPIPGTGRPPTVSPTPPGAMPPPNWPRYEQPAPPQHNVFVSDLRGPGRQVAPGQGRIVAVFGPPKVGVTSLLRRLHETSRTPTAILVPDFASLDGQIELLRRSVSPAPEVIFIDGFPQSEQGIQYLTERGFISPIEGAIIRVEADPELILQRGATMDALEGFRRRIGPIEEYVRGVGMNRNYFTVHNDDALQGTADLAGRAGLNR